MESGREPRRDVSVRVSLWRTFYCKGTALIRHNTTGTVFDIRSGELHWDVVSVDERQMGPGICFEAEVEHPLLGPCPGLCGNIRKASRTLGRAKLAITRSLTISTMASSMPRSQSDFAIAIFLKGFSPSH